MRSSLGVVIAASAAAVAGCQVHRDEDRGSTVSRTYQVGSFNKIEVAGPYQVEVRTGATPSVAAEGSEKLLERTNVEVQGDTLRITPEEHHGWFNFGWSRHGKAAFTVIVPQLQAAMIAGS